MEQPKVFFSQPLDRTYSDHVHELVASAARNAKITLIESDSFTAATMDTNVHMSIQSAFMLIADVTDSSPEVLYEVGLANGFKKPILLIAASGRPISFRVAGFRFIIYDRVAPLASLDFLSMTIKEAVSSPNRFIRNFDVLLSKRKNVFLSYSHNDKEYLDRILIHLKPLEREGLIDLWVDSKLRAGDKWKKEIESALSRATVGILLVSADFLASDFIVENELPPMLKNAEQDGTRIIPLIIKPCRFARDANLRHFQSLNDPNKPLDSLSPSEQELYYDKVAAEVEKMLL